MVWHFRSRGEGARPGFSGPRSATGLLSSRGHRRDRNDGDHPRLYALTVHGSYRLFPRVQDLLRSVDGQRGCSRGNVSGDAGRPSDNSQFPDNPCLALLPAVSNDL